MHTISIDDETYARIQSDAQAMHLPVEAWLRKLVTEQAPSPATQVENLTQDERLARMLAYQAKVRDWHPNADYSRDSIYP